MHSYLGSTLSNKHSTGGFCRESRSRSDCTLCVSVRRGIGSIDSLPHDGHNVLGCLKLE